MNGGQYCVALGAAGWPFKDLSLHARIERFRNVLQPVSKDAIAEMFRVDSDAAGNARWWRLQFTQANRTGLSECRASVGRSGHPSTYYPERVADWLLRNDMIAVDRLVVILESVVVG